MYDNKEKKQFFRGHMKRRIKACVCAAFFAASAFVFAGCSIQNMEPERIRDVEYTVVDKDEVPEEFKARIEEEKEEPEWNRFWMYWGIGGLALVFLCFVFYMEVSYVLLLWLAVTIIITTKAWLGSRNA